MHDLLTERLIQSDAGWHSLPGLFAAMTRGEVNSFPALRPHQRPAWHMFCVQLAVLALDAAGRRDMPTTEEEWRQSLTSLSPKGWDLVAEPAHPAFLQPVDPGGLKWTEVATPDALDMLITSRNHDIKREIAREAAPQDWLFALVSLQTMEGFGGAGNYGIARMNGGFSSRVLLSLAPARMHSTELDPSAWWRRDVGCLLQGRRGIAGTALVWLEPWLEGVSVPFGDNLDPLFIEVCRRIRLRSQNGHLSAVRSNSIAARIAGKDAKGNTGDPWAPVSFEGNSFGLGDRDFDHKLLVELIFSDPPKWKLAPLMSCGSDEGAEPMLIVAEAFARGQNKTDGFKSRIVPVPKAMISQGLFGQRPVEVAKDLIDDIATVATTMVGSLRIVACGGDPVKLKSAMGSVGARAKLDKYVAPAREALRHWVDGQFFEALWAMAAGADAEALRVHRLAFVERLAAVARAEFEAALPSIPCASLMRPRAEVRGRQRLETGLFFAMKNLQKEATDA